MNDMKNIIFRFCIIILPIMILVSCKSSPTSMMIDSFSKQSIKIPHELEVIAEGKVCKFHSDSLLPYKFVIYYDSKNCFPCRIAHLIENEELHKLSIGSRKFSVINIFSPLIEDVDDTRNTLILSKNKYPVYLDANSNFPKLNPQIPDDRRFHYFLLDSLNYPIFVGNPDATASLNKLFKEALKIK